MRVRRPGFVPDPDASRETMAAQQRNIAAAAVFQDDLTVDPDTIGLTRSLSLDRGRELLESGPVDPDRDDPRPIVAGIDQAFVDDTAVSAVVAIQGDEILEVACARTPLSIPYIPGLLAFREGGPIVAALESLDTDADLLLFDGSGRIHYRQAGIATHIGVVFDVPAIGVTKNLLCGSPRESLEDPLPAGTRIQIEADEGVDAPAGTIIGYAFQSRQFPDPERRHVNPLYVSPGHRVGAETAVDLTESLCAGYKLPEPIRMADRMATDCKD